MSNKTIKVLDSQYHRNGIGGIGFYAMSITWVEDGEIRYAVATVSADDVENWRNKNRHDPQTRVLVISHTPTGACVNINDTLRGDWFHDELCKYLVVKEDAAIRGRKLARVRS